MKRGTPRHPKMKRLARSLQIDIFSAVGIMEMLWHYTAEFTPQGDVARAGVDEIADALGWPKDTVILMDALVNSGWIDKSESGMLVIHDWPEHAEDSVHMKLARSRLCFADGTPPKISRLPRHERDQAEVFYGKTVRTDGDNVRTDGDKNNDAKSKINIERVHDKPIRAHETHIREFSRARGLGIGIGLGEGQGSAPENGNGHGNLGGFEVKPLADKLWHIHPSPSQFGSVEQALAKEIRNLAETMPPEVFAGKIIASLQAWSGYWLTEKRHATGLVKWITDGDYSRQPPIKKRAPQNDSPLETPEQMLEREARQNAADEAALIAKRAAKTQKENPA